MALDNTEKRDIGRFVCYANDCIDHFDYNFRVKSVPVDNTRKSLGEIMWRRKPITACLLRNQF